MKGVAFAIAAVGIVAVLLVRGGGGDRGPTSQQLRDQTVSCLNQAADAWDGGPEFRTDLLDAHGRPITGKVEKGPLNNNLEVRSAGPDGLFQNRDDIIVVRHKRHGETTINKEADRMAESLGHGTGKGLSSGIKEGLFGKKAEAPKK